MNAPTINIYKLACGEIGNLESFKINYNLDYPDKDIFDNAIINGDTEITKINDEEFTVEFMLNCLVYLPCSRCLKNYELELNLSFNQEYGFKADDENNVLKIDGNNIDFTKVIEDEIITNIPLKPLCNNNCKGIKLKKAF